MGDQGIARGQRMGAGQGRLGLGRIEPLALGQPQHLPQPEIARAAARQSRRQRGHDLGLQLVVERIERGGIKLIGAGTIGRGKQAGKGLAIGHGLGDTSRIGRCRLPASGTG